MKKFMTVRVWILLIVLILALLAIHPNPTASGLEIKDVQGDALSQGLAKGQEIYTINSQEIKTLDDFNDALSELNIPSETINVKTDQGSYSYESNKVGFDVDENLTISSTEDFTGIGINEKLIEYENQEITTRAEFYNILDKQFPERMIIIKTSGGEFVYYSREVPEITVKDVPTSNLVLGLDLQGGTRVLLKPLNDEGVTDQNINDLIKVLTNRLNVYGLSDVKIRSATDWDGNKYVLVEIAGVTQNEVTDLISQQGVFEAKIGENVVFEGGERDIPFVCRDDGSCSGVRDCQQVAAEQWNCQFQFQISLTQEAAKRHAEATENLNIEISEDGREILSETIDFYLDGEQVDSLQISADLKGSETTQVLISGGGSGPTRNDAINNAVESMDNLQTILITGSLPFDIEIAKLDTISPVLGSSFVKNAIMVALLALAAVGVVAYIRYRNFKVLIPMLITSLSELIIILGIAALIKWNLDIPAIAGIIAAIGTGIDDQIIILDETIRGEEASGNWKKRLKNAFFIIFAAYATTVAAMIPLWNAGAGLIRGLAFTTIIGVTIGVFLTRPAFASMVEKLLKE